MTLAEVNPTPLLSNRQYSHLAANASGMDLESLKMTDNKLTAAAARTADGGMLLGGSAGFILSVMILKDIPAVWMEIWQNADSLVDAIKFPASVGVPITGSFIVIGWVNRILNEGINRGITKPNAKAKLNNDLAKFMQSEGIPSF